MNASASTRHSKVELASFEWKENDGVLSLVEAPSAGPLSIVVAGFVASTVKVCSAGVASGLPA